ncbi:MAG: CGNR zinc finger domain-containing protein [Nocardioidaceae bacterium]
MQLDSHVMPVLTVTVRLVNALTPGAEGGRPVTPPRGEAVVAAVAEALGGDPHPRVAAADAERLAELAGRARLVFDAVRDDDLDAAATRVNTLLRETGARPQLDHTPGEGWNLHFHGPDDSLGRGWAAGCAAGLALALGSDLAGRLGVCEAPGCDRVYVDTSKNGGRRFCSARCQSRVKAAAHRARRG